MASLRAERSEFAWSRSEVICCSRLFSWTASPLTFVNSSSKAGSEVVGVAWEAESPESWIEYTYMHVQQVIRYYRKIYISETGLYVHLGMDRLGGGGGGTVYLLTQTLRLSHSLCVSVCLSLSHLLNKQLSHGKLALQFHIGVLHGAYLC